MKRITALLLILFIATTVFAQKEKAGPKKPSFGIKFKGYVKTDIMVDSRQTVSAREGHFLLYPQPEFLDANGDDINARPNTNMLAIQTRLTGVISAPDAFGAKTSGVIEGAFFGHSNADINGFRLRHAFLKLQWQKSTLIVGQYWHPMFITEVFPGVVSFTTGVPFQPFSRNPQVRYIRKMQNVYLTLVAAAQRDFSNTGPSGGTSSYMRNSALPLLDANLKYKTKTMVLGAGANIKTLLPRLNTQMVQPDGSTTFYKNDEKITSIAAMAFARINKEELTIKAEAVYGENLYDVIMLGGYAVKSVDPNTGTEQYTNIKTMSAWGEIIYGKALQFALFGGYSKNLGASDDIVGANYSRGANIANLIRVAPRVQYTVGKVRFAGEIEYTTAAYGTPDIKGEVQNTNTVGNLRTLLAAYLFF